MKEQVDLRLVQFSPMWLDPRANATRVRQRAEVEASGGADIIVFPELSNVGYVTPIRVGGEPEYPDGIANEDEFRAAYFYASETIGGPFVTGLSEVARDHGCVIVAGMSRIEGDNLMNSAVVLGPSGVLGIHDKLHIPPQEKPFFAAGRKLEVFDTPVARIGLAVCYDSRFPEMSRFHARHDADLSLVVYAGADTVVPLLGLGDSLLYRSHVRAQENGIFFAVCNRVGVEGSSQFFGKSVVASPTGKILALGDGSETTVQANLAAGAIDMAREVVDVLADLRPEIYGR
jgi:predicted amidohydrolase